MRKSLTKLTFLYLLLFAYTVYADEIIKQIRIEGILRSSEEFVRSVIQSREGKVFDKIILRDDIKRIWALDIYEDVRAVFKDGILTFYLKEKPIITKISFEGRDEISEEDFNEIVFLKEGDFFDELKLQKQVRKILELYFQKGYLFARVSTKVKRDEKKNTVEVQVKIHEGEKFSVKQIVLVGAQKLPSSKIKKYLPFKEKNIISMITGASSFDYIKFEESEENVKIAYLDFGFLDAKVKDASFVILPQSAQVLLIYPVREGRKYKVSSVLVEGDIIFDEIEENFTLKPGEWFSRKKLVDDIRWISLLYQDVGYSKTNVFPLFSKRPVSRDFGEVDVKITIEKGNLTWIRTIEVEGNTRTRDWVIRRRILISEGELYSFSALSLSHQNLFATGFFEEVNIYPMDFSPDEVDVKVSVSEGRVGLLSFGAGFIPSANITRSIFGLLQGNLRNFQGYGRRLGFFVSIGGGIVFFNVFAEDPHFLDTNWILGANAFNQYLSLYHFIKDSLGGSITVGQNLTRTMSIRVLPTIEFVRVRDLFGAPLPLFWEALGKDRAEMRAVEVKLLSNTTDHPFFPTRGHSLSVWSKVGGFGGDLNFVKGGVNWSVFIPLVWKFVFSQSLKFGIGRGIEFPLLPYPERFFAGGIDILTGYTIRGFYPYSIGRRVQYGVRIGPLIQKREIVAGGNAVFVSNTEIVFPIVRQIGLSFAVFFDSGTVWYPGDRISLDLLRASVGFGFRWLTPFAPLRFEFGFPILKRPEDIVRNFDFSIGLLGLIAQ